MQELANYVSDVHTFYEKTNEERQNEAEQKENKPDKKVPPVFNKRLYVTSGNVVITKESRRIMSRISRCRHDEDPVLSKSDIRTLRSVVEGLKLIHKDQGHIKDALSYCVTLETYDAFQYVVKKPWENVLSCYYIVHGAVEVTYDMRATESRSVYQPNIIYSHGTGEYLGIVSSEDRTEDIAPPATIYTKEFCEFLRIDRDKFHRICERFSMILLKEIRQYVFGTSTILSKVSIEVREKILPLVQKEEYSPNKTVLQQDETSEYLHFIISGRCKLCRDVFIPEAQKMVTFYIACKEPDDFFGEEGVLDNNPSYNSIITTSPTIIYRIPRIAFDIVNKESLSKIIAQDRDDHVTDAELMDRGYYNSIWKNFKHSKVKEALKEHGKLKYMCQNGPNYVVERPPTAAEQHKENMYRFIQKGAEYEPFRPKSAMPRPISGRKLSQRPQTVGHIHYRDKDSNHEDSDDSVEEEPEPSQLITRELAQTFDTFLSKLQGNEEDMMKALEENSALGKHLRKAWEAPGADQREKDGFMENGVLATMKSEDIVRKAIAMADKKATRHKKKSTGEEEWDTVLHAENKQAKFMAAANNMRVKVLRTKMEELQKRRASMFGKPKITEKQLKADHNNNLQKKKFMLDRLSDLGSKSKEEKDGETVVAMTGALFISKTRNKCSERKTQDDFVVQEACNENEDFLEKHLSRLRPSSAVVTKQEQSQFTSTHRKGPSKKTLGISTSSISSLTSSSSGYKSSQTSIR